MMMYTSWQCQYRAKSGFGSSELCMNVLNNMAL